MGPMALRVKKTHSHNQIKPCCSWRYIKVVRHETIGLCKKPNSIYIIFYLWSTARSNCPERIHNIRGRDASTWHSRCMRGSDRSHIYVTHCLDRFHACFYYARAHWHVTHRMDVLRTVRHCGGSVVKKLYKYCSCTALFFHVLRPQCIVMSRRV